MTSGDSQPLQMTGIRVRLARTPEEILAAQRLRYKVFYEEFGAKPTPEMKRERRDFDAYDDLTDHLIVVDENKLSPDAQIVGTYRLLRQSQLPANIPFYTSHEFNIEPLLRNGTNLLELGRSCVLPEYRTRPVLKLLWQGITAYLKNFRIDLLFGCASFSGVVVANITEQLSYLYHFHRTPDELCPTVLPGIGIDMNLLSREKIEPRSRRIFSSLPPLIKGYLRVGCTIGDGAYIDHQFNTIDVCIVLPSEQMTGKYLRHYERANSRLTETPGSSLFDSRLKPKDR